MWIMQSPTCVGSGLKLGSGVILLDGEAFTVPAAAAAAYNFSDFFLINFNFVKYYNYYFKNTIK